MSGGNDADGTKEATSEGTTVKRLLEKIEEVMEIEVGDQETIRMAERMVVLRISTKHINLWMRQLEMKSEEICELAGLMGLQAVRKEISEEKSLERWARRCSNFFTKKVKRMLFGETDNMVWSERERDVSEWCKRNKVYDEITEAEIEEIWMREAPDEDEPIRLNGKFVWETAKRVCDFINAHEELVNITTFGDYRVVMKKVMKVIKEAHNVERKRRQASKDKKKEETRTRTQKAKALIQCIRRGGIGKDDVQRRLEEIFGGGSSQEISNLTTMEEMVERIEELSKREQQFDEWENMRREAKRKQRDDRRLNLFWRRNKCFPTQFGGEEETPEAEETLNFWRSINNKEVSEG